MKLFRVISADLRHYRAANMAIAAAVAVCAAVLLGGLLIGDSVSYSLGRIARLRLGRQ